MDPVYALAAEIGTRAPFALSRGDLDALNIAAVGWSVARTQVQPLRVPHREYQCRGHIEVDAALRAMLARPAEDPIAAAAYVAWRLPWIHPYRDGNGRTSRAAAYAILLAGLPELRAARRPTVPERIERTHAEYIGLLNPAHDEAWRCEAGYRETVDLGPLERYLWRLVEDQLAGRP
jgi:hypothetical protein